MLRETLRDCHQDLDLDKTVGCLRPGEQDSDLDGMTKEIRTQKRTKTCKLSNTTLSQLTFHGENDVVLPIIHKPTCGKQNTGNTKQSKAKMIPSLRRLLFEDRIQTTASCLRSAISLD